MCGLAFLFDPGREPRLLQRRGESALDALAHRGPDDHGSVLRSGGFLGHRRLSILDLQASRQPMPDPGGRYWLAYNGEIYNYQNLRLRLQRHWRFRTQGDTEVLLAGLILHGERFLEEAEGMWALVLWDTQANALLLARDRMGEKPLYYRAEEGRFAAASELPALQRLLHRPAEEDADSTADYLRYGFFLPGTTAYRGVREVLPGHVLTWSQGSGARTGRYWGLAAGRFEGTRRRARGALREALENAVRRRLVADVEVGAFLSGGVDSSLVVALAARLRADPLKTFTIGFEDASFDERAHARAAAGHLGTEHREAVLGWDPEALRTLVLGHVGQPFADASILPTALVSALAASGVKVALTGDGGDELFSGYQRYMGRTLMRWYTCLPAPLRGAAERAVRSLPEPMAHHSHSLLKKANLFLEMVEREGGSGPYVAPRLYDEPTLRALAPDLAGRGHPPPVFPEVRTADEVEGMMRADALVYLPQDILLKVDRASMAHSLETRPPFLDTRVVELAFSCPSAWHRGALSGKRLLREGLGDLLPGRIWRRRKQGFGVPVHQWFRGELGGELEGLLSSEDTPLAASRVLRMLDLHRRGVRDNGYRLWQIYIYVLWRSGLGGRATLASAGGTGP